MPIFNVKKDKLEPIKESKIDLEKDVQALSENNLETVFGLKFISSEFSVGKLRIDTLAFDEETGSFVIIEYKRDRSFSVVDQGFAYLSVMLNNKADFVLEFNEKSNKNLNRSDVDWSQSRVIFIANSFTTHQQKAIEFKDLPIELWEVKRYSNGTILYNELKAAETAESINKVTKNREVQTVSREVKKYTVDDHFKQSWQKPKELFEELRNRILDLTEVEEKYNKQYIAYSVNKSNFAEVVAMASGLKIYVDLKKERFEDPKGLLNDCSKVGHWATGDSFFKIFKPEDIDYAMFLIKQV